MSFFKVLFFICIYSTCLSVCASEYSFQEKSQEGARLSWSWSYCGCHLPIMETGKKNRSSARVANVLSVFPALKMPFLVTPINWSMDVFLKYGFCRFFSLDLALSYVKCADLCKMIYKHTCWHSVWRISPEAVWFCFPLGND